MSRRASTAYVAVLCAAYAGILLSCLGFGLPSRERLVAVHGASSFSDTMLSRMTSAWSAIAGSDSSLRQALNQDSLYVAPRVDTQLETMRALRRMALYTTEPDEMHIPMALGRMRPRAFDFNPRFFQYGGLLFYGAAIPIAAGGLAGLFPLSGGLDAMLRDPDAMGRLYVCGRLWVVLWTALMPWFTYRLARLFLPRGTSFLAAVLAAATPGFLAWGPVLKQIAVASSAGVLGVLASARAARSSRDRDWLVAGAAVGLAGAAFVTHFVLGAGLAAAWLARWREGSGPSLRRAVLAVAAAVCVFLAWNPYWILDPASVLADARAAMDWYRPDLRIATVTAVAAVIPSATGHVLALFGPVVALVAAMVGGRIGNEAGARHLDPARLVVATASLALPLYYGWRMTGVADLGPIWCRQFVVLGPLWSVLLLDAAHGFGGRRAVAAAGIAVALSVLPSDIAIVRNFQKDTGFASTRFEAGRWIARNVPAGSVVHVNQVVGPFSTPFFPIENYAVRTTGSSDAIAPGEWLVVVGTANLRGNESLLEGLELVAEFPSVRIPFAPRETFGFANGPVRIWRRPIPR